MFISTGIVQETSMNTAKTKTKSTIVTMILILKNLKNIYTCTNRILFPIISWLKGNF